MLINIPEEPMTPAKLLLSASILLATVSITQAAPPKPDKCPSVSAITAAGVDIAERNDDGQWIAGRIARFDTKQQWGFAIGFFDATDRTDALKKANAVLATLTWTAGPIDHPNHKWACGYKSSQGYSAGAITPSFSATLKTAINTER